MNPPPEQDIPSPPAGFMAPDPRDFLGYRPRSREIAAASTVVADLGSADDWVATFGSTVPSAATLATALSLGLEWGEMRSATAAWDVYAKAEYSMAWKSALLLLDQLKPVFLGAVAKDPALAQQYPGLMQMFDAPKAVAKQAVATRKKNAKAKADTAAPAAQAAAADASGPGDDDGGSAGDEDRHGQRVERRRQKANRRTSRVGACGGACWSEGSLDLPCSARCAQQHRACASPCSAPAPAPVRGRVGARAPARARAPVPRTRTRPISSGE